MPADWYAVSWVSGTPVGASDWSEQGEEGRQRQSCLQSFAGPVHALQRQQKCQGAAWPNEGIWHPVGFSFSLFLWCCAVLPSWFSYRAPRLRPALGCPALGNMISRNICFGFSPAGGEDLLAGGGVRAIVGLALAICNGDSEGSVWEHGQASFFCKWGHIQLRCETRLGLMVVPGQPSPQHAAWASSDLLGHCATLTGRQWPR